MEEEPEQNFEKRLSLTEKKDVAAIIDHLITVGAYWENRADCKQTSEDTSKKNRKSKVRIHVADQFIYTNPERKVGLFAKATGAEIWDLHHGDTINPIAFMDAKLSKKRRHAATGAATGTDEDNAMNGTNNAIDTTICDLTNEQVPRALLNQCWQRALHAASNPVMIDDQEEEQAVRDEVRPPVISSGDLYCAAADETPQTDFSPERARAKCEAMGIRLRIPNDEDDNDAAHNKICPSCDLKIFDTNEQLQRHFYGLPNQRGCCWRMIDHKHHELVDEALQAEVEIVIKQIIRLILANTHISKMSDEADPLDWKAVMVTLQHAVTAAKRQPSFIATTCPSDDDAFPPHVLNASLMKLIQDRLVDRYADLPR